jgi:hypothetical protein
VTVPAALYLKALLVVGHRLPVAGGRSDMNARAVVARGLMPCDRSMFLFINLHISQTVVQTKRTSSIVSGFCAYNNTDDARASLHGEDVG